MYCYIYFVANPWFFQFAVLIDSSKKGDLPKVSELISIDLVYTFYNVVSQSDGTVSCPVDSWLFCFNSNKKNMSFEL